MDQLIRPADAPIEWHPDFESEAADGLLPKILLSAVPSPVSVSAAADGGPLEAHGMTGSLTFDGICVTIDLEEHATDRSADRRVLLPLGQIDRVEWIPATNTHRGLIRFLRPSDPSVVPSGAPERYSLVATDDPTTVSFKARQQPAFEAIRDAVTRCLRRPA